MVNTQPEHVFRGAEWLDAAHGSCGSSQFSFVFWGTVVVDGRLAEYNGLKLSLHSVHTLHAGKALQLLLTRDVLDLAACKRDPYAAKCAVDVGVRRLTPADRATLCVAPNEALHNLQIPDGGNAHNHVAAIAPVAELQFFEDVLLSMNVKDGTLSPCSLYEVAPGRFKPATRAGHAGFAMAMQALADAAKCLPGDNSVQRQFKVGALARKELPFLPEMGYFPSLGEVYEFLELIAGATTAPDRNFSAIFLSCCSKLPEFKFLTTSTPAQIDAVARLFCNSVVPKLVFEAASYAALTARLKVLTPVIPAEHTTDAAKSQWVAAQLKLGKEGDATLEIDKMRALSAYQSALKIAEIDPLTTEHLRSLLKSPCMLPRKILLAKGQAELDKSIWTRVSSYQHRLPEAVEQQLCTLNGTMEHDAFGALDRAKILRFLKGATAHGSGSDNSSTNIWRDLIRPPLVQYHACSNNYPDVSWDKIWTDTLVLAALCDHMPPLYELCGWDMEVAGSLSSLLADAKQLLTSVNGLVNEGHVAYCKQQLNTMMNTATVLAHEQYKQKMDSPISSILTLGAYVDQNPDGNVRQIRKQLVADIAKYRDEQRHSKACAAAGNANTQATAAAVMRQLAAQGVGAGAHAWQPKGGYQAGSSAGHSQYINMAASYGNSQSHAAPSHASYPAKPRA